MTCPICKSNNVEVPMVDIGVGEIQCGPAGCLDCGWVEEQVKLDFETMKPTFYSHRSGIETSWDCDRKGYFEYLHAGTGFVQHPQPPYLDVGTAVHQGLDGLINGYDPETVINAALRWFVEDSGQNKVLPEQRMFEHCATIEGGLWAFTWYSLLRFLQDFEVLGTEVEITDQTEFDNLKIKHMSRPDAIVRTRMPDFLSNKKQHAVISWKTIDDVNDFRLNFYRRDLQTLMEAFYASKWLRDHGVANGTNDKGDAYYEMPNAIDFTQTIFIQKGKFIDEHGLFDVDAVSAGDNAPKFLNSILCYQWVKQNKSKPGPDISYAYRYQKEGKESYSVLGSNYKRERITNVRRWIEQLAARQVFPACDYADEKDPLEKVIIWDQPQPYDKTLVEQMIKQVKAEEHRRFSNYLRLREYESIQHDFLSAMQGDPVVKMGTQDEMAHMLDRLFPRHINACHVPWRCHYDGANGPCFGPTPLAIDAIPDGYVGRTPHHPAEKDAFREPRLVETPQYGVTAERLYELLADCRQKGEDEMSTAVEAMTAIDNAKKEKEQVAQLFPPTKPSDAIKALITERDVALARVEEINKELQAMANDLQSLLPPPEKVKRKRGPNKPKAAKAAKE